MASLIIIGIIAFPTYFICLLIMHVLKIGNNQYMGYIAVIPTLILSPIMFIGLVDLLLFSSIRIIFALVITIPIIFIFHFILTSLKIGNDKSRGWISTILTIFGSPIIYILLINLWLFLYPSLFFSQTSWKNNAESRHTMAYNIINSEMLIGKPKKEVIKLLGKPESSYDNELRYNIGFSGFGLDPEYLVIHFKNGKIYKVEHYRS